MKPDWEALTEAYAEGAADVEIAKMLDITIARFYQLCEEVPAFNSFAEKGRTLSQAWWYEKGRRNLSSKTFNTALWNFNMKNRFGWADRVESNDVTNKEPTNRDQVMGQLQKALKTLGAKNPEILSGANLNVIPFKGENAND